MKLAVTFVGQDLRRLAERVEVLLRARIANTPPPIDDDPPPMPPQSSQRRR